MFAWVSRKMQAQHPNLHISYTHFSLSQAPEIIKSGKTQLIFGEDNALWQRPDVRFIPLYREEHTLVLPADHALANRPSLSLSDLKDETFVLPSHRPWIDHLNRLCELPGGEYLENYIPVSDFLSYTTDVLVYRAVAIIPKRMYLPSDQTAAVPLVPDVSFYFGFLCPRSLTERSVQIMDCCKAFLKVQEAEKNA